MIIFNGSEHGLHIVAPLLSFLYAFYCFKSLIGLLLQPVLVVINLDCPHRFARIALLLQWATGAPGSVVSCNRLPEPGSRYPFTGADVFHHLIRRVPVAVVFGIIF